MSWQSIYVAPAKWISGGVKRIATSSVAAAVEGGLEGCVTHGGDKA